MSSERSQLPRDARHSRMKLAPAAPAQDVRAQAVAAADERLQAAREQICYAVLCCLRQGLEAAPQVHLALQLLDQVRGCLARIDTSADA